MKTSINLFRYFTKNVNYLSCESFWAKLTPKLHEATAFNIRRHNVFSKGLSKTCYLYMKTIIVLVARIACV